MLISRTLGRLRITRSASPAVLFVACTATALLQACVVSRINPDATERANAHFERLDQTPGPSGHSKLYDQLRRLWQDQPQYV